MPRLGLSEFLAIAPLVRDVSARATDVMLLAKRDHVRSLRSLFEDLPNVRFTFVTAWDALQTVLVDMERHGYRVVPLPSFREACPYDLLGLNVVTGVDAIRVHRRLDAEHALYRRVLEAVGHGSYVVIHHDDERRLRSALLPRQYAVVNVRDPQFRSPNIFDWLETIDKAAELHAIDSCFLLMADSFQLGARAYLHAYTSSKPSAHRYKNVITIY